MKKVLFFISFIVVVSFNVNAQIYFSEDFNVNGTAIPSEWLNIDNDGDGYKWGIYSNRYAGSASYSPGRPLFPDNWLITPAIDLTSAVTGTALTYKISGGEYIQYAEHYKVFLSTTNTDLSSFTNLLYEETIPYYSGIGMMSDGWIPRTINLEQFIGQTVYIAFVHCESTDINTLLLDNVVVKVIPPIAVEISIPDFVQPGSSFDVKGSVTNGRENLDLSSYTVIYNINGGADVTAYQVTDINIPYGFTHHFTHNVPASIAEKGIHTINVTVSTLNEDSQIVSAKVNGYENTTPRKVLLEFFTTANTQYGVTDHNEIEYWLTTRSNVIRLTHHAGRSTDGLSLPESKDLLLTFYNDSPYSPWATAVMLDRTFFAPSEPGFYGPPIDLIDCPALQYLDSSLTVPAFVTVDFSNYSFNSQTRECKLTVNGKFVDNFMADDLRLSLYIKEDNLKTTPAQAGSWEGENYIHQNTIRAAYSNIWGDQGVITSGTKNSTYSKEYTTTIPQDWKIEDLTFIAFVSKHNEDVNKREILNSNTITMETISSVKETTLSEILIYPNPASNKLFIQSNKQLKQIDIYNIQGQLVKSERGNSQEISISDLTNGMYIINLTTDSEKIIQKFIKQ